MRSDGAAPIRLERRGGVRAELARRALWGRYRLRFPRGERISVERVEGVDLVVLPTVFKPGLLRSGRLLARVLLGTAPQDLAGKRVLDLGCGSGVGSVHAALRGAHVTAVDLNPAAVRNAAVNARAHALEHRVDVRAGDLFDAIAGERFDLILFNPPFFEGAPAGPLDLAFHGRDVFERFAAGLPAHLAPGGSVVLVLSTDGEGRRLVNLLERSGAFTVALERHERYAHETLVAYRVAWSSDAGEAVSVATAGDQVEALR